MFGPDKVNPSQLSEQMILDLAAGVGTNYGRQKPYDPYDRSLP